MSLILPGIGSNLVTGQAPFTTTLIEKSVWMDGSADGFTRAASDFDDEDGKEFTLGTWFQLTEFGVTGALFCADAGSNVYTSLRHSNDDKIYFQTEAGSAILSTPNLYRDIGWYHLLLSVDTTQVAARDRVRLFINGEEVTLSGTQPSVNHVYEFNLANKHEVGDSFENGAFEGYLAQSFMIGSKSIQQGDFAITDFLDTYTFGTNGSQFIPKKHSEIKTLVDAGSDNSFLLDYEPADPTASNALGLDISSYGNNFTSTSMGSANQSDNTPSKVYPIVNALTKVGSAASTLEEGNTKATVNDNGGIVITPTLPFSGLWYFEINVTTNSIWNPGIGQQSALGYNSTAAWNNTTAETHVWLSDHSGNYFNNNGSLSTYPIANPTTGRFAVAWDGDNRALYFGQISGSTITWTNSGDPTSGSSKTGAAPGNWPTTGTDPLYFIVIGGGTSVMEFDFDEDDWTGSTNRPAAAKALNSENLTAPDYQGIDYFDATIYEGNGIGQRVGDFVPFTDVGTISQSVAFNAADEDELRIANSVSTSPTNVQKKTVSCWLKPLEARENWIIVGNGGSDNSERIYGDSTGRIQYLTRNSGSSNAHVQTAGTFLNDPSQWVHVVVALDYTDGSTEADRVKIYVNGVRQTDLAATTYPANNMTAQAYINKASTEQIIGCHPDFHAVSDHANMYYAEYFMVDGHQLDASVFGQLDTSTNRWVAKASSTVTTAIGALSGGFGTCGFYLDFSNTSDYGEDDSGNNRDFTEAGVLDATNKFTDSPSLNFPIIDIGTLKVSTGTLPLAKGGLQVGPKAGGGGGAYRTGTGFSIPEGSWIYKTTMAGKDSNLIGLWTESGVATLDGAGSTKQTGFYGINMYNGELSHNKTETSASDAASIHGYTWASDISSTQAMNVLINRTGNVYKLWFVKDGATAGAGNPTAGTGAHIEFSSTETVYAGIMTTAVSHSLTFDFGASNSGSFTGNSNFSDYKLINQDNLDDTASKLTAWAWIKNRDADDSHILVDRVRGVGEVLHSDLTDLEATEPNTVQRFFQRGVQVGNDVQVNTANESYVLWQWLVGEAATTTTINASSTTPTNSIASTVAAADAGHFSVVGYQGNSTNGATVAHSLGGEPELIFFRGREGSGASSFLWRVFSTVGGAGKYLRLHDSTALQDDTGYLNNTLPGSVVFTLGTDGDVNNSSYTYIAYCFRSVPGVCKVGSYTGNGDNDGPYISVGFLPKYVLVKSTTANRNWNALDTTRNPINIASPFVLLPNDDAVDTAGQIGAFDILADGFKPRDTAANSNASGETYLYMAIADIGGNGTFPPIYGR